MTKLWQNESWNKQKIIKLKIEYLVASNCPKFYVATLNKEIIKNKDIHHYYKSNDKQWFDLQNIILKATSAVVKIANLFLEAGNKNEVLL